VFRKRPETNPEYPRELSEQRFAVILLVLFRERPLGHGYPLGRTRLASTLLLAPRRGRLRRRRGLADQALDERLHALADGREAGQRLEFRPLLDALEPGARVVGQSPESRQDEPLDRLLLPQSLPLVPILLDHRRFDHDFPPSKKGEQPRVGEPQLSQRL